MRDELNNQFGYQAELKPGTRGSYEVFANGNLIFSKLQLDRFPNDGEIVRLINGI